MQDAVKTDHDHQGSAPKAPFWKRRWVQISVTILSLAVLVLGLILIGRRFGANDLPQFVTSNLLNALIFTAIVGQVLIYRRQRDIMQHQWESMQGQLLTTKRQSRIMAETARYVNRQASIMAQGLKQTEKTADLMYKQLSAMQTQSGHQEGQLRAMAESLALEEAKTDPRLRVSKIRIENFDVGKAPIFIVTIANGGLIDATGVEVHIGIAVGADREFNWITPQTAIIPARWQESYPVRAGMLPDEQLMQSLTDGTVPIEVKVRLKYWPRGEVEFCYKYFPWPRGSERPDDIPQFFDCDFRANVNHVVRPKGIEIKLTGGSVGLTIQRAEPKDDKPEEETNGEDESEDNRKNPN